jgi:hypothetical protein
MYKSKFYHKYGSVGIRQDFDQKFSIWMMKLKRVLSRFDYRCFHFRHVRKVVFLQSESRTVLSESASVVNP